MTNYSLPEMILWYSLLVVSLFLLGFYIYKLIKNSNRKKVEKIVADLDNLINKVDQSVNLLNEGKNDYKKIISSFTFILEKNENTYLSLKEVTSLDDFDKIIEGDKQIERKIKKISSETDKEKVEKDLIILKEDLIRQKNRINSIQNLVK